MTTTFEIDATELSESVMKFVACAANPPAGATGEEYAFRLGQIRGAMAVVANIKEALESGRAKGAR